MSVMPDPFEASFETPTSLAADPQEQRGFRRLREVEIAQEVSIRLDQGVKRLERMEVRAGFHIEFHP